jgi:hypothetical protein
MAAIYNRGASKGGNQQGQAEMADVLAKSGEPSAAVPKAPEAQRRSRRLV